jgi:hypothetical protein
VRKGRETWLAEPPIRVQIFFQTCDGGIVKDVRYWDGDLEFFGNTSNDLSAGNRIAAQLEEIIVGTNIRAP